MEPEELAKQMPHDVQRRIASRITPVDRFFYDLLELEEERIQRAVDIVLSDPGQLVSLVDHGLYDLAIKVVEVLRPPDNRIGTHHVRVNYAIEDTLREVLTDFRDEMRPLLELLLDRMTRSEIRNVLDILAARGQLDSAIELLLELDLSEQTAVTLLIVAITRFIMIRLSTFRRLIDRISLDEVNKALYRVYWGHGPPYWPVDQFFEIRTATQRPRSADETPVRYPVAIGRL